MGKTILVDTNIKTGENLLKELDKFNYPVSAALWVFEPEKNAWTFVVQTPELERSGPNKVYSAIQTILDKHPTWDLELRDIGLARENNILIAALKSAIRTAPNAIEHLRLTGNTFGNLYIDDALVYRLS